MSRSLGPALPEDLRRSLAQSDLEAWLGRALPLVTLDAEGRPHPMLLSYVDVLAVDPQTLRVVVGADSRSARNLAGREAATLLVVEPERILYVKCRVRGAALRAGDLARFELRVEDVLEDAAADWEGAVRVTSGILYSPAPALDSPEARAVLALLRRPPDPAA